MKKMYQKPEIQVVTINHSVQLLQASKRNLGGLKSNAGFNLGGGYDGEGRSRGCDDDWDDEDW
jgi:hypothetical protein